MPTELTPVLLARSDAAGVVAWCRCEVLALNELQHSQLQDPALAAARQGAQTVAQWLSQRTEAPCQARLTGDFSAAGNSAAGAGFHAAVRAVVGDRAPANDACTAGWDPAAGVFTAVKPTTLAAKFAAAQRWALRRVWVCAEQPGIAEALAELRGEGPTATDSSAAAEAHRCHRNSSGDLGH